MNKETAQRLLTYMQEKHGVTLPETDIQEIERILSPSPMEGKGLNLKKLSEKVDNALTKETEESLNEFLNEVNAKEEGKTPLKGWANVYRDEINNSYSIGINRIDKEDCDKCADAYQTEYNKRIACIDLSKHYEGEGL